MIRATVSEQQNVRDLMFAQEIVEEHGPFAEATAKVRCGLWPVDFVACANVDPLHLHPGSAHGYSQLVEERTRRSL
jgi:hypothetical protein